MGFAAGLTRLELATSGLTGRRTSQIEYSFVEEKYRVEVDLIYT